MSEKAMGERGRLERAYAGDEPWLLWGPYLNERQWGTVREDYSPYGNAWDYFPHDHARSRAYRWGEDGIAGISDNQQRLCLSLAMWNGADPILKERMFGLTNSEGNHGEDVKEYYFYLDNTPTHSLMRMLYKYPQRAFPYADLVAENARRKGTDPHGFEYELLDTGVFEGDRYFDVEVEYTKRSATDILMTVRATNRGPDRSDLVLMPTLFFRNTWSWRQDVERPVMAAAGTSCPAVDASHPTLGSMRFLAPDAGELLFCENETNSRRLYGDTGGPRYPKDGINDFIVDGRQDAINPTHTGTKAAAVHRLSIGGGETATIRLRLTADTRADGLGDGFDAVFAARYCEADTFYASVLPATASPERRMIHRQACAGMLWSKQFYHYIIDDWLEGDGMPPPSERLQGRNTAWRHFYAEDVLSMPDKWEYPWFASWDLSFHTVVLARLDPDFAKLQIDLLGREWYMSPDGQVPAYEWAFDDVNPPVRAWAALQIFRHEEETTGRRDVDFLESAFQHSLLYFTWWVNRKDADGNKLFQGGFLGMDNIGAIDRTAAERIGFRLYQVDATSWVGFFALNLMEMAMELSVTNRTYLDFAVKFLQHFIYIADALNHVARRTDGRCDLWDEEEGFFFDVALHDGKLYPLKVRSLVGPMPLLAVSTVDFHELESEAKSAFKDRLDWFAASRPELLAQATNTKSSSRLLLSMLSPERLKRILKVMLDEEEFLSPHGIRSVSRRHFEHPYNFQVDGEEHQVAYEPAESGTGMFGGNSNWRGPVWMPVNVLLIESLRRFHEHCGDRCVAATSAFRPTPRGAT
jgi:hypothetical protein